MGASGPEKEPNARFPSVRRQMGACHKINYYRALSPVMPKQKNALQLSFEYSFPDGMPYLARAGWMTACPCAAFVTAASPHWRRISLVLRSHHKMQA